MVLRTLEGTMQRGVPLKTHSWIAAIIATKYCHGGGREQGVEILLIIKGGQILSHKTFLDSGARNKP
jgi:hypothetical protein